MAATEPPLNPISAWLIVIARVVEGLGENLKNVRYPPGSMDPRISRTPWGSGTGG